jgi:hypothetical protein
MMILKTSRANLSSNDQLSLDLPFAATKSLTARVGPTPTFTRGSGATYIGSDGLIHGIDTSTTSNTIGTGSRTFTLAATAGQDQLWRAGDAVEASNGSNIMAGTVTSYDAATQSLVCNMTSTGGSGTFTSWRIGYRGPRFDHDPTSPFACRGLLIEESRTNLTTQSGNASSWISNNGTVTNNGSSTAPDGSSAGYLAGMGTANLSTIGTTFVTGSYVATVFLKRNNTDWVRMQFIQGVNINTANFWINLATGAAGAFSAGAGTTTLISAQVTPFGNGWYRCSIAVSFPATDFLSFSIISATANNSLTRVSGSVYEIWGGQIEAGSFATSYIPTTTGSVVRSADVCSITGGNFNNFYNQSEGTVVAVASEFRRGTAYVSIVRFAISSDASGNRFQIGTNGNKTGDSSPIEFIGVKAGVIQYQSFATSPTPESRAALAYKTDDIRGALNGTLSAADSPPSEILAGANSMSIGTLGIHIASIRYYRKRLPNAKLQALTV